MYVFTSVRASCDTRSSFYEVFNKFEIRVFLDRSNTKAKEPCLSCYFIDSWRENGRIRHHHHHHVVPPARISLTLARNSSILFIASGRSSELHPVSSQSCCMWVRAGRLAFVRPYEGVHRRNMRGSIIV